jgi:pyruvate formate lyase activating enzyme
VLDYTKLVLLDIKTFNAELHPRLTGVSGDNPLRFLDELKNRNIPTWIRHVIVPGLTDNEEELDALGEHLLSYPNVEKIEVLPYHTMGAFKYEKLGIPYPLAGVEPLSAERVKEVRAILGRYKPVG